MSAFTVCALAALGIILIVAAVQVSAESRRERRHIRTRCCCGKHVLTEDRPFVTEYNVTRDDTTTHEIWRCPPQREEVP